MAKVFNWSKKNSLANRILVEACYWIINFEKIKNKRNDSNFPIQKIFLKKFFFLSIFLINNCCRAMNVSKKNILLNP